MEINNQQQSHLFTFEPGDGTSYWVLFGQQQEAWGAYTIFGFGEHNSPLLVFPFQGLSNVSFTTFTHAMRFAYGKSLYLGDADYIEEAAWTVFCALIGQNDAGAGVSAEWMLNWRSQLPSNICDAHYPKQCDKRGDAQVACGARF